ncbi:hypothetical protein T4D_16473 [Trichinella pseudospiralis]|uniref:Transmembrane protein n=1 Tax=Trichinella pseudospiralis TaxID=6337 RepID=A0A0V1FAN1_TRIPS|nr:hypothetical protein T4D_16473 [Trichinella pseudospiralis]
MSGLCVPVVNEESNETYWDNATCSQLLKMPNQASLIIIFTSLVVTIVIGISTTLVNFISCITIFKDFQSENDNAQFCNIYLTITFMIKGMGVVYSSVTTLLSYVHQRNLATSSVECFWQLFPIRLCNCILENIFFVVAAHWHMSVFTPTLLTGNTLTMLNIMQPICVLMITAFVTYVRSLCVDNYMMPLCHTLSSVIPQKQIRSLSQFPALVCFTFLIDLLIVYWIISSRHSNALPSEQSTTMHVVPPKAKDPFYYIVFGTFGVYCFAICFGELINNYSPMVDIAENPLWYNSLDVFFHLEGLAYFILLFQQNQQFQQNFNSKSNFITILTLVAINLVQSTFSIASDIVCHFTNLLLSFIVHFMQQTVMYLPTILHAEKIQGRDQFVSSTPNTGAKSVEEIWGKVKFFTKCQAGTKHTPAATEVTNNTRTPLTLPLPLFPKLTKAKTMPTLANHEMMQKVPVGYPLQRRLSMTNELNQFVAACPTSEPQQAGQAQLTRRTSAVSEMSPMRHYKSKSLVNGVQAEWISSEQKYTPFRGGVDCKRNKGSSVDCQSLNLAKQQRPHENNQDFGQNGGGQADDGGRTTPNSLAAAWRNSYTLHRSNADLSGVDLNPASATLTKSTSNNIQARRLPLSLPQQQAAYTAQFQAPMTAVTYDPSAVPLPYPPNMTPLPPWAAYAYTPTTQQWMMTMPACNGKSPTTNFEQKIPQAKNSNSAGKPQVKKMLRIISVIHMLLGSTISLLGILRKVFATHMATGVECLVGIYVLIVGIIALSGLKRQNNCLLLASFVMATLQCVFLLFPIFTATQSLNHFAGTALGSPIKETVDILTVVLSVLQLTAAGVFLAYACSVIATPLKQSSDDEEKSTKCEQQQKQQSADQQTTANSVVSQPQNVQ